MADISLRTMASVVGDRATSSVADIDKKLKRLSDTLKLLRRNASKLGDAADHGDTTSLMAELNLVTTLAEEIRSELHEVVPDLPLLPNNTSKWSEAVAGDQIAGKDIALQHTIHSEKRQSQATNVSPCEGRESESSVRASFTRAAVSTGKTYSGAITHRCSKSGFISYELAD